MIKEKKKKKRAKLSKIIPTNKFWIRKVNG